MQLFQCICHRSLKDELFAFEGHYETTNVTSCQFSKEQECDMKNSPFIQISKEQTCGQSKNIYDRMENQRKQ